MEASAGQIWLQPVWVCAQIYRSRIVHEGNTVADTVRQSEKKEEYDAVAFTESQKKDTAAP